MSLPLLATGKVRDIYEIDEDHLLLVVSDRVSAFDVVMNEPVPDRGRILCALTEYWLTEHAADLPHHFLSSTVPYEARDIPDIEGRSQLVRRADMLPVEFIVRAYLAGSGWKEYQATGTLHGQPLPAGLQLGSPLPEPILTPSTKADVGEHDINLSRAQAVDLIGDEVLSAGEELSLEMFRRASRHAQERGFILADTKFELGWIDGTLSLCDEVLTPDSSRYWPSTGWSLGKTPPPFDKQVLRDWLETQPWDKTPPPPTVPDQVVTETRSLYVEAYERLTGLAIADWPGVS